MPVAAIIALQGLRQGQIQPGQKVLVDGASGGVGTFAVQIAKSFGTEVTAVCSPQNLDNARSMGADHVIDYTQEDFTKKGQRYDLILAANGRRQLQAFGGEPAAYPPPRWAAIMRSRPTERRIEIMQPSQSTIDIDSYWEYTNPAVSEKRFRTALSSAQGDVHLELLTQIARTFSLRQRFDEAHEVLNGVEKQLAITYAGMPEAIDWNQRGLVIARTSQDAKARALIPAMLNNSAWDLHEMGRFREALPLFEEAQAEWVARGKPEQIRIAKWAVARCFRSLGRYDEALTIQRALEAEHMAVDSVDGYVFEEIAENLAALGKIDEARPYFEKAFVELRKDEWFVKNESTRLSNLKARAGNQ